MAKKISRFRLKALTALFSGYVILIQHLLKPGKKTAIILNSSYSGYEMISKNIRWVMAGRYADSTQPKTKLTAILSPNFTNKNTAVFAVLPIRKQW